MWIGQVELPEGLINAQMEGRLVIFAGAGVSRNPPSNLPNFNELVMKVQDKVGKASNVLWDPQKESPDRFLGRLKEKGPNVHKLVWEIINNRDSKPTELHYDLLSLFRDPQEVRIVTTNFDRHFTTAAAELFGNKVPIYYAPALPLGHRFNGIVYIHGCVDQRPEDLILTDSDFGRAYLIEGWATRFLVDIFRSYEVLFVGYSHSDLPMEYLGRGLPPETKRYALVPEDEIEKWKFRGIQLITYPCRGEVRNHNALVQAVKLWANQTKMGLTEHEQRIKDIVQNPPSLDKEQNSYMEEVIRDPVKVRIFTKYADTVKWLRWVEERGLFKPLFSSNNPSDEISQILASWFAEKYVCQYAEDALALVLRQGQVLSPLLWKAITSKLWLTEPLPEPKVLAKWVVILLSSSNLQLVRNIYLGDLLQKCCHIEYARVAILIFKHITTPYLVLDRSFSAFFDGEDGDKVTFEVNIPADKDLLDEVWVKFFRPNFKDFAYELESTITYQLKTAYLLLCSVGRADNERDPVSLSRTAIEPHEQDRYPRSIDFLIDAARDIIEYLVKYAPNRAQTVIQEWALSNVPILKRLAIYGMTIDNTCSPDEKIKWILTNNWLFAYELKHEVFQLLKIAYPKAEEATRQRILNVIEDYLKGSYSNNNNENSVDVETRNYEVYNLLYWLVQSAPHCLLTREKFDKIQAMYPEFEPRKHPDLDIWMEFVTVVQSPITVDELLSKHHSEIVEFLLTYQGEKPLGPTREGLLLTVKEVIIRSFSWGWELVRELESRKEWDTDLWQIIISGWQEANLNEDQWRQILQFFIHCKEVRKNGHEIARLLKKGVEKGEGSMTIPLLLDAELLADQLWYEAEQCDDVKVINSFDNWAVRAINHIGGIITQFWILALFKQIKEKEADTQSIFDKYRIRFENVISGESIAAAMGRIILAGQLHFLFSIDRGWTRQNIIPLLNWDVDAQRAQQAWEGYLWCGKYNDMLLQDLLPLYEQAYNKLSKESKAYDWLCVHLASIAVRSSINPVENGWLDRFIASVDETIRVKWANKIKAQLTQLPSEAAGEVWNRWVKDYLSRRIDGIPVPLSQTEMGVIVEWVPLFKLVFPDVVNLIVNCPPPSISEFSRIYYRLVRERFAEAYPEATAKLLVYLLSSVNCPFYWGNKVKDLFEVISQHLSPEHIKPLREQLIRLGII